MKLILGSDYTFLLKYGYELTGIPKDQMNIGYVITASLGARNFSDRVQGTIIPAIKEAGYALDQLDIKDKSEAELRNFFKDKNVIHVEGGNTFYLLKVIRETGFDKLLKEFLAEGKVYVGTSAGSYVMCPTIEEADWSNDGRDRYGMTDFTALGYVPFLLKVHYKDEMAELIKEKLSALKYPLRILRDGQGIVAEDGKYSFVGDGSETTL